MVDFRFSYVNSTYSLKVSFVNIRLTYVDGILESQIAERGTVKVIKDVMTQISGIINSFNLFTEAFAASEGYANNIAEYQITEYMEETTVHAAAVLREIRISAHGNHARTGVRADWMEQDGPTVAILGEMAILQMRNHAETGTCNRCQHWHKLM